METTFKQLKKEFETSERRFVQIKNEKEARKMLTSKASASWGAGQPIGKTGWIQLATPSTQSKGDRRTVFVCKTTLVYPSS
tara:strand:+ start:659 stop:901 length:243 start_codon:yes stop_codon:yes gene_type:complete